MKKVIKKILIISTFLILTFTAISCAGGEKTTKAAKNVTLTFATGDQSNSPATQGAKAFAEKLAELSGETMTVEFVNMTKYSSLQEMFDFMSSGAFDMVGSGYADIGYSVPEVFIFGYIVKDFDHFQRIMDSPFGRKLSSLMYEGGFIVSPPMYIGTRRMTSNIPINSATDFKKITLRITPSPAGTNFAEKIGADYRAVAWSEVAKALADGTVDAQENPMSLIESAEIYKYQTHLAYTEHSVSAAGFFLRRATYDTFSSDQKMWYNEAIAYGVEACNEIVRKDEATLLDKFINEYGMTVTYPDLDEIQALIAPDINEAIERFGANFVEEARSIE